VKGCPGEAGHDDDPDGRLRAAAGGRPIGLGMSSCSASLAERKGVSPDATRPVYVPEVVESGRFSLSVSTLPATQAPADARPTILSKRPATLRCARSGGPGPSAAGRAPATGGSRTTGGAAAVAANERTEQPVDRRSTGNPLQYPASTPGFPPYAARSRQVARLSRRSGGEAHVR